jgi:hypothetical protein
MMANLNPALMGSLAVFFSAPPLQVPPVLPRLVTNVITIPAFVTIPEVQPTRFLTAAEQTEFVTALRRGSRVRGVLKLG